MTQIGIRRDGGDFRNLGKHTAVSKGSLRIATFIFENALQGEAGSFRHRA
jgi:hypothetical protein